MAHRRPIKSVTHKPFVTRCNAEELERRMLLSTVSFQPLQQYAIGDFSPAIAVADLGNGHADLVSANEIDSTVSVLLGNGDGTFQPQVTFATGAFPASVAIADLGNGHPDLIVANSGDNTVGVLLGNGDGSFQPQRTLAAGMSPMFVAVADLGNGAPDLLVANGADGTVSVLLGNGDGSFQPQQVFATGGKPISVAVADLGNGHPDLVVANNNDATVSVLLGNGDGSFQTQQTFATGPDPSSVAVADLGGGHPDIVVANNIVGGLTDGAGTVSVLLGNGDGSFQSQQTYGVGAGPTSVALADLGNGDADIVVANSGDGTVSALLGNGDGTFQSQQTFAAGPGAHSVAIADLGNGQPDLVIGTAAGEAGVLLNNGVTGATNKLVFATGPAGATTTSPLAPIVVNIDNPAGVLVSGDNSNVTLTLGGGTSGAILGGTTTVAAINGVATFSDLSIAAAGTGYTLMAADGGFTPAVSTPFNVTAAPPPSPVVPTLGNVILPAAILAGAKVKGKLPVIVTNEGGDFKGRITFNIFADAGTTLDGNQVMVATMAKTLSLKANRSKTVNFSIKTLPPALGDGAYHLLAQVVDPNGLTNVVATAQTVQVAAAFVQLAITSGTEPPTSINPGQSGTVAIVLTNNGNVDSVGPINLTISPSDDAISPLAGMTLASTTINARIKAGASQTFKVRFNVGALAPGGYFPFVSVSIDGNTATGVGSEFAVP